MANLDVMRMLADEAITELLAAMPSQARNHPVILIPFGVDERYDFLTNQFSQTLTSNGYRIYQAAASNDSTVAQGNRPNGTGYDLEYQALDFSLTYPKVYRSYLIGGKKVKRSARIRLLAKVIDPRDQSVIWVGEALKSQDDQFAHKYLSRVEAGLYDFTKPQQNGSSWGKIVEPVVVSGIIVGLIYLFFSNQNS